jgi:putative membrane protein
MDSPADTGQKASLSDYLAAERTLLAWIRTGLALMGFGFVVARFGLFLQQLQIMQRTPIERSYGLSLWFGTALIAVGVIVNVCHGRGRGFEPRRPRHTFQRLRSVWRPK